MGSKYMKGDRILHLSSSRCTGETFVFTDLELRKLTSIIFQSDFRGRWHSPKKWHEQLKKKRLEQHG